MLVFCYDFGGTVLQVDLLTLLFLKSEPRRVVSAIKGSRVKEGIKVESVLRVRWAPDVYDPPVTSDDHTLKKVVYKPRAKPVRKEYYSHKNKHSKSKTLHQGRSRSQHTSKSSSQKTVDQRMLRYSSVVVSSIGKVMFQ